MTNRFSTVMRLFFVCLMSLLFLQATTSAQELSKKDIKRLNLAKKQSAADAEKMTKMVKASGKYPYLSSMRPVVEDVWEAAIILNITMKPTWDKLPLSQKKKASVSLFKLWSSLSSMQSPERYPWIKIRDSKGRTSNLFAGYKNRMLDNSITQDIVTEYEKRVELPNVYGKP